MKAKIKDEKINNYGKSSFPGYTLKPGLYDIIGHYFDNDKNEYFVLDHVYIKHWGNWGINVHVLREDCEIELDENEQLIEIKENDQ